jgi:ectoine hydroxylase-related dioxygenase (phytanoyl-CoA dioxygenase family)
MYREFDELVKDSIKNEKRLLKIIKDDITLHVESNFKNINQSLFMQRGIELKFIFISNKTIFWDIYYFLGTFNQPIITDKNKDIQTRLLEDGIVVLRDFLTKEELNALQKEHTQEFEQIIRPDDKYEKRSQIIHLDNKRIDYGNKYHARDRISYKKDSIPKNLNNIICKNEKILKIVQEYTNTANIRNFAIYEKVHTPIYHREDRGWHIDTLMDQFKVLVALNDIDEDTAPFTYVKGYHKKFTKKQESRYHHIYANGGYQAGILNHFEEDFVEKAEEQIEGYIKAGDIVLFDSRIQHSIKYANNGKHRDNIMLYFSNLRTNRNRFLGWIDEYHLSLYST